MLLIIVFGVRLLRNSVVFLFFSLRVICLFDVLVDCWIFLLVVIELVKFILVQVGCVISCWVILLLVLLIMLIILFGIFIVFVSFVMCSSVSGVYLFGLRMMVQLQIRVVVSFQMVIMMEKFYGMMLIIIFSGWWWVKVVYFFLVIDGSEIFSVLLVIFFVQLVKQCRNVIDWFSLSICVSVIVLLEQRFFSCVSVL